MAETCVFAPVLFTFQLFDRWCINETDQIGDVKNIYMSVYQTPIEFRSLINYGNLKTTEAVGSSSCLFSFMHISTNVIFPHFNTH